MARSRTTRVNEQVAQGPAFLLSQVGAHSSARFAERLEPLGLRPPHVGILGVINQADGLSQQALGERLGIFPSRLVAIVDEMERLGLIERRNNPSDRRSYALYLTKAGREMLVKLSGIAREHQDSLCAALTAAECAQLTELLSRIAAEQGLKPGIHPGYRRLQGPDAK
jgi:DNA-binding MarR family transcriptional regulator